jgi:hypothetical protein
MSELTTTATTPVVRPARSVRPALIPLALAVVAISVLGGVVAVATGVSANLLAAMGPTGRLSVPIPMVVALVVLAILAARRSRAVSAVSSALLGLATAACIVSGFFDGGYGDSALTIGQRVIQAALVAALAGLGVAALARFAQVVRERPRSRNVGAAPARR